MTYNIGKMERLTRVFVGSLLIGWGIFFAGKIGTIMCLGGLIPLLSGFVGNCPLYSIFKINPLEEYENIDKLS